MQTPCQDREAFVFHDITDTGELLDALCKYHAKKAIRSEIKELLDNGFLFGYKGVGDFGVGYCYAFTANGLFFIDACNESVPLFYAVAAVKKVIERLFAEHTDTVYCGYEQNDRSDVLCRRAGFKEVGIFDGKKIFRLTRS